MVTASLRSDMTRSCSSQACSDKLYLETPLWGPRFEDKAMCSWSSPCSRNQGNTFFILWFLTDVSWLGRGSLTNLVRWLIKLGVGVIRVIMVIKVLLGFAGKLCLHVACQQTCKPMQCAGIKYTLHFWPKSVSQN